MCTSLVCTVTGDSALTTGSLIAEGKENYSWKRRLPASGACVTILGSRGWTHHEMITKASGSVIYQKRGPVSGGVQVTSSAAAAAASSAEMPRSPWML